MAIMTGVQSAQILGPQAGAGILEPQTETEAFRAKRLGRINQGTRTGEIRKKNDNSIIDFIN